jgi:branched-chain amino acid transport system substrate-binding protein
MTAGGSIITTGAGRVWAVGADLALDRIDPRTGAVTHLGGVSHVNTIAYGLGAVWATTLDGTVLRVDPASGRVTRRIPVPASSLAGIATGHGSVWVTDPVDGTLFRIELGGPRPVMRTIAVGLGAAAVAATPRAVWVANGVQGTLTRIDPRMNGATTKALARPAVAVAGAGDGVWAAFADEQATPARHVVAGLDALPAPCSQLTAGPNRKADLLLAADLPLQGPSRDRALAVDAAVRAVLGGAGYHAGRFRVAYQACDDSTPQGGAFEYEACARNAHAYAGNPDVVAVLGSYYSGCSSVEIPIANRAPQGPLLLLSPASSDAGLTHAAAGSAPGQLAQLYPTGVRSFARVQPDEDAQAVAGVAAARRAGIRRVDILRLPATGGYGLDLAAAFAREARRAGLRVVRERTWDASGPAGYRRLAAAAAADGVDGVYLAGGMIGASGLLLRELHDVAHGRLRVVAPDGFIDVDRLAAAVGPRAPWLTLTVAGRPTGQMSAPARAFVRRLAAHPAGGQATDLYWPQYAAQAAEALLAAVARSDGTRAGVRRALFAGRAETTFGPAAFDSNGDIRRPAFTLLRLAPGGAGMSSLGPDFADGTTPVAVVHG